MDLIYIWRGLWKQVTTDSNWLKNILCKGKLEISEVTTKCQFEKSPN